MVPARSPKRAPAGRSCGATCAPRVTMHHPGTPTSSRGRRPAWRARTLQRRLATSPATVVTPLRAFWQRKGSARSRLARRPRKPSVSRAPRVTRPTANPSAARWSETLSSPQAFPGFRPPRQRAASASPVMHRPPILERGPSQGAIVFGGDKPPHAEVVGGCVGCHLRGTQADANGLRGQSHDFVARPAACTPCHSGGAPQETVASGGLSVRERARKLWAEFGEPPQKISPLASPTQPPPPHARRGKPDPEGIRKLLLVVEDPAAGVHNAPYARALLDEAERLLRK